MTNPLQALQRMQSQASSLDRHSEIQTLHHLTADTKPGFPSLLISPIVPSRYQRRPFNGQTTLECQRLASLSPFFPRLVELSRVSPLPQSCTSQPPSPSASSSAHLHGHDGATLCMPDFLHHAVGPTAQLRNCHQVISFHLEVL